VTGTSAAPIDLTHRQILVIFGALSTAMLLAALEQTIVATALPTIVGELGGLRQLSWIVTAYLLTATVSVPLYGKVSDLFGRKLLFQLAIVVFVLGSLACAASQSMGQLVAARALQGAGAGGLMAMAQTIIGDVVSPRERGRYMGYIGAVFGVSSVAGPLLGGFFVDQLTWRWVFGINVPLGLLALVVTQRVLRLPAVRLRRKIDYAGAALLTAGAASLLLVLVWGGQSYSWASPTILGLGALAAVSLVLFALVERNAQEPILPPELFRERVFAVATMLGFIVGAAMFGSIIYLPLFLQVVTGVSATDSGLLLTPLIGGLLVTSIASGRLITRSGRYKAFPILGTAVLAIGLACLSTMDTATTTGQVIGFMVVVGAGIGLVMQVLVLAVQNAVPRRHLGTATSATQFFRSIGGTVGVATFGALVNARLTSRLALLDLPGGIEPRTLLSSPTEIGRLPAALRGPLQMAMAESITGVFALAVPLAVVGFALACLLREVPLRNSVHAPDSPAASAPAMVAPPAASDGDVLGAPSWSAPGLGPGRMRCDRRIR
jgi:EmrB/QacA subfamily drug resistance transporter